MKKKKSVLKRTAEASKKKRLLAIEKKFKKQKEFNAIWEVLLKGKELKRAMKGDYQNLSCSLNEICRTAESLGIKTVNGKRKWQRIQVKRLLFIKSVYDGQELTAESTLEDFLK